MRRELSYWLPIAVVAAATMWVLGCYLSEPYGRGVADFVVDEDEFGIIPVVFVAPAAGLFASIVVLRFPKCRTKSRKLMALALSVILCTTSALLWVRDTSRVYGDAPRPVGIARQAGATLRYLTSKQAVVAAGSGRQQPISYSRNLAQKTWNLIATMLAALMTSYLLRYVALKIRKDRRFNYTFLKSFGIMGIVPFAWLFTENLSHGSFKAAFANAFANYELPVVVVCLLALVIVIMHFLARAAPKDVAWYSSLPAKIVVLALPPVFASFLGVAVSMCPRNDLFHGLFLLASAIAAWVYCAILAGSMHRELDALVGQCQSGSRGVLSPQPPHHLACGSVLFLWGRTMATC